MSSDFTELERGKSPWSGTAYYFLYGGTTPFEELVPMLVDAYQSHGWEIHQQPEGTSLLVESPAHKICVRYADSGKDQLARADISDIVLDAGRQALSGFSTGVYVTVTDCNF